MVKGIQAVRSIRVSTQCNMPGDSDKINNNYIKNTPNNKQTNKQTKNNKTKTEDYPALEYPIHKADWDLDKEMLVMNQTGNTNLKRLVKLRASRRNKIAHDPG